MRALLSAILFLCWQVETQLPTAHTALAAAFLLSQAAVGKDAMNKFENPFPMAQQTFLHKVCVALPFNEDLLKGITFSQMHLQVQYFYENVRNNVSL